MRKIKCWEIFAIFKCIFVSGKKSHQNLLQEFENILNIFEVVTLLYNCTGTYCACLTQAIENIIKIVDIDIVSELCQCNSHRVGLL